MRYNTSDVFIGVLVIFVICITVMVFVTQVQNTADFKAYCTEHNLVLDNVQDNYGRFFSCYAIENGTVNHILFEQINGTIYQSDRKPII
jgi:uncharacterized membrane protein